MVLYPILEAVNRASPHITGQGRQPFEWRSDGLEGNLRTFFLRLDPALLCDQGLVVGTMVAARDAD
jgi:hypothetical protein